MKVFFRRIHLYMALAAGLIILIACLTGAILVFEKDLQMALNKKRYYVEAEKTKLSIDKLINQVEAKYPDAKVNDVKLYEQANRSAEVSVNFLTKNRAEDESLKAKGTTTPQVQSQTVYTIFVNPYTVQVLEKYSYQETWFYQVLTLHRWLLGDRNGPGKYIVGISTFIFLFILSTGIILWWPKTRKILTQRLKIKRNAGWKRIIHDMHLVFGFYSAIFLFIFAFTGLSWSFQWFNGAIYKLTNSPFTSPVPPASVFIANAKFISFDEALAVAKSVYTDVSYYNIAMPKDSAGAVSVSVLPKSAIHESAIDVVYIDQYSGKVLSKMEFADRSLGARVRATFEPVHTGSIWGTSSKILAFIVCVVGASFPITGTIMWINRTRKKKKTTFTKLSVIEEED